MLDFVRVDDLAKIMADRNITAFHDWQAYRNELCKSPALAAYYDFFSFRPGSRHSWQILRKVREARTTGFVQNATWQLGGAFKTNTRCCSKIARTMYA